MNWSGISDKSLLGRVLRLPLRLLPARTVMPIVQGRLKGKKWIVGSGNHGCWLGSYEFNMQSMLAKTITPGSIVFDLGAHAGFYTLLASELAGAAGKVFAFEPLPRNVAYLNRHLRLNHVSNAEVIEAAVSDKTGLTSFDVGASSSMGHISAAEGSLQVKTVSLDDLIASGQLPAPDFMKIDIEGAEALALAGAKTMLARSHPTIFLATHGARVHEECCRLLRSLDYELEPVDGLRLEQSSEIRAVRSPRSF